MQAPNTFGAKAFGLLFTYGLSNSGMSVTDNYTHTCFALMTDAVRRLTESLDSFLK